MLLKNITISGLGGVGGYYGAMLVEAARREGLGRTISFVARAHTALLSGSADCMSTLPSGTSPCAPIT